jgi:hypothetical protein
MKSLAAAAFALVTFAALPAARAEVHVGVNIGVPAWTYEAPPPVVVVPGYPSVHYAPDLGVNFFSYGGHYYTYDSGRWYTARGDSGPWSYVERRYVPGPVIRVPARYYRGGYWGGDGDGHGHGHGHGKGHRKHHH